jgi:hypothetical protein
MELGDGTTDTEDKHLHADHGEKTTQPGPISIDGRMFRNGIVFQKPAMADQEVNSERKTVFCNSCALFPLSHTLGIRNREVLLRQEHHPHECHGFGSEESLSLFRRLIP